MKRTVCVLLAAAMLCLCACGRREQNIVPPPPREIQPQPTPEMPVVAQPAVSAPVASPSPGPAAGDEGPVTVTADAVYAQLGIAIALPEGAQDAVYSIDGQTAHAAFTYEGAPCTLRMQKAGAPEDIGGGYATATDAVIEQRDCRIAYDEGGAGAAAWYDQAAGVAGVLHMESGADAAALQALCAAVLQAADAA